MNFLIAVLVARPLTLAQKCGRWCACVGLQCSASAQPITAVRQMNQSPEVQNSRGQYTARTSSDDPQHRLQPNTQPPDLSNALFSRFSCPAHDSLCGTPAVSAGVAEICHL